MIDIKKSQIYQNIPIPLYGCANSCTTLTVLQTFLCLPAINHLKKLLPKSQLILDVNYEPRALSKKLNLFISTNFYLFTLIHVKSFHCHPCSSPKGTAEGMDDLYLRQEKTKESVHRRRGSSPVKEEGVRKAFLLTYGKLFLPGWYPSLGRNRPAPIPVHLLQYWLWARLLVSWGISW